MSKDSPELGQIAGSGRAGLWPGDTWAIPAGLGDPTLRAGHQAPQPLGKKCQNEVVMSLHPAVSCEFTHQLCGKDLTDDQFYLLIIYTKELLSAGCCTRWPGEVPSNLNSMALKYRFFNTKVSSVNWISVYSWPELQIFLGILLPEPRLSGMGVSLLQLGRNKGSHSWELQVCWVRMQKFDRN